MSSPPVICTPSEYLQLERAADREVTGNPAGAR